MKINTEQEKPSRTKAISLRMLEEDYLAFKKACHNECKQMATVTYELILAHLAKLDRKKRAT